MKKKIFQTKGGKIRNKKKKFLEKKNILKNYIKIFLVFNH
jgi:hypothetical protein